MMVRTSHEGDVSLGTVESKVLDVGTTSAFKEAIRPLLLDGAKVVLDLSRVEFIDSSGLGALVSCLRVAHGRNAEIKLFGLRKPVRALFELVRMHRVFEVFNSADEAISSYKG